ncbi:disease resistance protein RUN1-like isoform X2 [Rhodamnia argentea]|uniref:Disease resistance protein RUN1-like isoform X2 n=1 Tax=Rhodamnia argentea TaxID=178133 RepID=A0ABM3H7P6_9MYRT|nr:disease resistance protein RUN1-like isoform X2 [Rhodamnia argentea]
MPNRGKGEFVKDVVNDVLTELKTAYLELSDCLVEVDNHVDEIIRMVGPHDHETKIVGIHGMGGVGKTTLAKIVYNQLSNNFVDCCFLGDIRKKEITRLQNQLLSTILKRKWHDINDVMEGKKLIKERLCSKTVLLLLDDADEASQLGALMHKREWFGKGSRIIITTRDQGILKVPTLVDGTYELTAMDFDHSLQLFSKHAFRRDYPLEQYVSHSERAVNICSGLPLALEVVGSLLSGKSVEEWDVTLKEQQESPQEDVGKKLMISIEALNENQRKMFLDIACFFIGYDRRIVIPMWESCKFLPHQSLGVLQQRSLIKIKDDNQLWMHDWLRDVGRNFIQQGSGMKPEKQQWVWTHEQALDVLEKTQNGGGVPGIGSIEAICLEFDELSQYSLIKELLASLSNLRFLQVDKKFIRQVDSKDLSGDSVSILTQADRFQYHQRLNFVQTTFGPLILPELRWLSWNYFPMDFELTNFSLRKLVILDFSWSEITEEWAGWSYFKTCLFLCT